MKISNFDSAIGDLTMAQKNLIDEQMQYIRKHTEKRGIEVDIPWRCIEVANKIALAIEKVSDAMDAVCQAKGFMQYWEEGNDGMPRIHN